MNHRLAALGLTLALILAAPVAAPAAEEPPPSEQPPSSDDPGALARDGLERLLRALEAVIHSIPQYEMPEINENGDIIIRRKRHPDPTPEGEDEEGPIQTDT